MNVPPWVLSRTLLRLLELLELLGLLGQRGQLSEMCANQLQVPILLSF
jgi:hypothetical protein